MGLFKLALRVGGALLVGGVAQAAPPAAPEDARGAFALYCAQECGELVLDQMAVRARLPLVATRPVVVVQDVTESWLRPTAEELAAAATGGGDLAGIATAGQVVLVSWAAPPEEGIERLAQVLEAAQLAGNQAQDVDTGRLLDRRAMAELRAEATEAAPDMSRLIVVEVLDAPEGATLTTRGLARLGLPELRLAEVAAAQVDPSAVWLNATAQAVWEDGLAEALEVSASAFASASAREAACGLQGSVRLEYARGNGRAGLAQLVDPQGEFGDCGTTPEATAPEAPSPAATAQAPEPPAPDSLAMVQARSLARLKGPVRAAFQAGLPAGDKLMVKAPFQDPAGKLSWLWIGVESWSADDRLAGPLLSAPPPALGLQEGQRVEARLSLLFDYLWKHADGSTEGNETQALLH